MKRIVVAALAVAISAAGITCGGTNGRETLPSGGGSDVAVSEGDGASADATLAESDDAPTPVESGSDSTLADGGAGDATVIDDASNVAFDVAILYADRVLPDVVVRPPMGEAGEAGYPWPSCPPFVPVVQGRPVPLGQETDQIRATYDDAGQVLLDDAGRVVPVPDGSACANYGWLGSAAIDSCVTRGQSGPDLFVLLPPCNWCAAEAGTNNGGARKGDPKYDTCLDLYACIRRTRCDLAGNGIVACLCADASTNDCTGAGLCGAEELAALESPSDPASIKDALMRLTNVSPALPGYCGRVLNQLFHYGAVLAPDTHEPCFPPDAGPF